MFYWLIGSALLIYCVIVNLRLHMPCFDVCWSFGVVGLKWYPCCRLKHNWSVHVDARSNKHKFLDLFSGRA